MQASIVNRVFYPSLEEIAKAKQLIENFDQQERGVIQIDGRLVDESILKRAQQILALAELSSGILIAYSRSCCVGFSNVTIALSTIH